MTPIPKTSVTDKAYRDSFRDRSCIVCGFPESIGHHIGHDRLRDDHLIPLCGSCHMGLHNSDNEAVWWAEHVPDLVLMWGKCWAERQHG